MYDAGALGGAVSSFTDAAASGMVAIRGDEAAEALKAIKDVKDDLAILMSAGAGYAADVQLGANPVGQAMARKSVERFSGQDSMMAVLKQLVDQTEKAENALKQCIANYVATDGDAAAKYPGH